VRQVGYLPELYEDARSETYHLHLVPQCRKCERPVFFPHTFTAQKAAVPTETSQQAKSGDNTRAS
jgi:hypothetical protein